MKIGSLEDMYIAELQELASAERLMAECLARLGKLTLHSSLKRTLLDDHREATEAQRQRVETLLRRHRANPESHVDQTMQAMISETERTTPMLKGGDLRDAGLIASLQRLTHYEIAVYRTVAALARQLRLRDDERMPREALEEEEEASAALAMLAEREVMPDAWAA
jgi:ferritin-like metal-binding protein YciE